MAVALEALQAVNSRLPSGGRQPATQLITRLTWGLALGLVALEIAAQATGQQWSWTLNGFGRQPPPVTPYRPLFGGSAFPFGPADRNSAQGNLTTDAMPGQFGSPGIKLQPGTAGQ
jgi:hypothetical protein